ncbi:amidase [Acinetobacter guillouiae]|uniref:amidase n=1 Tax=Acinetobacter guillouiae TaxID=106649 RepID=UPI001AE99E71|nr:amidase [Acinetobacter guillouiae]MBP2544711.1 aspartyl-tRNA(Asn)/glutamyl-tRNA(Gln) amidotransferase subunit A [Acinetobacter guillouiae]
MLTCPVKGYFSELDVEQIAKMLRSKEITAKALTQQSLNSINQHKALNAFCYIDDEYAIQQAEYADELFNQGIDLSPLQGIPIAIKDNIETAQLITAMGSNFFKDYLPEVDAECVQQLKALGAVIIGKTNTHEFAYGPTGDISAHGATKNPWNLAKISGGSSCGSAVAVAAGLVPIAIGTDTGGSIRIPASLTGVMGFKPTYQQFPMKGVFPLSKSLDHLGILAKSAQEIDLVVSLLKQEDHQQSHQVVSNALATRSPKLGWVSIDNFIENYDYPLYQKLKQHVFSLWNNQIDEVSSALTTFKDIHRYFYAIQNSEAYAIHHHQVEHSPELFQKDVLDRLLQAKQTKGWEYVNALDFQKKYQEDLAKIFDQYDYLIMPTLPIQATDLYQKDLYLNGAFINIKSALLSLTNIWNFLGNPVLNVPLCHENKMPIGIQIIGAKKSDRHLLAFAVNNGF